MPEDYNLESLEQFVVFGWLLEDAQRQTVQQWSKALLATLGDDGAPSKAQHAAPKQKSRGKDKNKGEQDSGKEAALSLFS